MTPAELAAIRLRVDCVEGFADLTRYKAAMLCADVAALLAEVERLQERERFLMMQVEIAKESAKGPRF